MSEKIKNEQERLRTAYHGALQWGHENDVKARELYAAKQALAWAENPEAARSPFEMIMDGPVASEVETSPPA